MQAIHEHYPYTMFGNEPTTFSQAVSGLAAKPPTSEPRFAGGLSLRIYVGSLAAAAVFAVILQTLFV